ncbi:MAG: YraN family protein [Gammaproteobacteria bacterium]|nr:YraN family protein [Gammaproteobacteria bacterium]
MSSNPTTLETGQHAEQLACEYLTRQGLKLIKQNFRCQRGEIDLIMKHNKNIIFTEVRYRKNTSFGTGAETVTYKKQAKLIMAAQFFFQKHPEFSYSPSRFDVVSISQVNGQFHIDWIKDAFQC